MTRSKCALCGAYLSVPARDEQWFRCSRCGTEYENPDYQKVSKCYSDHDEDIRTKGSCDYCEGTELEQCSETVPTSKQ